MLSTNNKIDESGLCKKLRELGMPETDLQADKLEKTTSEFLEGKISAWKYMRVWSSSMRLWENA